MNWIPRIFRRKLYDDLSEEIRLHIEERAERFIGEGMSRKETEQKARRAFGNLASIEERSREVWQWAMLESIWGDVRFALRQLRRSPGFTIGAVLTLRMDAVLTLSSIRLESPRFEDCAAVARYASSFSRGLPGRIEGNGESSYLRGQVAGSRLPQHFPTNASQHGKAMAAF
jgi:hypothetical protein